MRRAILTLVFLALGANLALAERPPKLIVLGFDGMDYQLTKQLMAEGRMPNFQRLADQGGFTPLGTAVPPQSPVAWSNFITGLDSGGHGIFDFIHRDPATMLPFLSTTKTEGAAESIKIGKWQIPTAGGEIELLRQGTAFWDVLEANGIETTIIRMPANFPPSGTATKEISGMGTPDILGTYGIFSFFTTDAEWLKEDVSGGKIYHVTVRQNAIEGSLEGPPNPFLVEETDLKAEFEVFIDPVEPVVKLVMGDTELILRESEWSDWVTVTFDMIPTQTLSGITRFYLKSVRPHFELYAAPVNMDPMAPAMPVSTPGGYAKELAEATGLYYTQGMPEDTQAHSNGVLDRDEFLAQAKLAGEENLRQYEYVLNDFDQGFLFYYFGNLDLICHMMWRTLDPEHPAYDIEVDGPYADVIPSIYEDMDAVVGQTLAAMNDEDVLVVMSDHGFSSWRRAFNLNSWLRDNGFITLKNPNLKKDPGFFGNVDWYRTKAYGLGINGLYINTRGRERQGNVSESEREAVIQELTEKLLAEIDPTTGLPAVSKVYRAEEIYGDRGHLEIGPDLLVGYAKGVRGSNASSLGEMPEAVMEDNTDAWSGDHCMDHDAVPGILLTSRPLKKPATTLKELGSSILTEMEVEEVLTGK